MAPPRPPWGHGQQLVTCIEIQPALMAWVAFSGLVGVNTLISVFVPASIAISAVSTINTMIYDTPAADLVTRNEYTLLGMSVLTSLVTALHRLSGVDGRPAVEMWPRIIRRWSRSPR